MRLSLIHLCCWIVGLVFGTGYHVDPVIVLQQHVRVRLRFWLLWGEKAVRCAVLGTRPHVSLRFADAAGGVAFGYELVAGAGEVLLVRA